MPSEKMILKKSRVVWGSPARGVKKNFFQESADAGVSSTNGDSTVIF